MLPQRKPCHNQPARPPQHLHARSYADLHTRSYADTRVCLAHGGTPGIAVAATHGLLVGGAAGRLGRLPVRCLVTTDSLPQNHSPAMALQVESVAPLLADAIGRLHQDQPLAGLLART